MTRSSAIVGDVMAPSPPPCALDRPAGGPPAAGPPDPIPAAPLLAGGAPGQAPRGRAIGRGSFAPIGAARPPAPFTPSSGRPRSSACCQGGRPRAIIGGG